jgi:hypothetical protein
MYCHLADEAYYAKQIEPGSGPDFNSREAKYG